jgi:NAD+ synthase (glutamine-hydrolysing)
MESIWKEIVRKTGEFVNGAGYKKVVVGVSGGIDSAVVACIGAAACGGSNVLAVMMPSPHSSAGSVDDSGILAANWGIETVTVPITPLMASFDGALEPFFSSYPRDTTEENIQARIRAVLLMAMSNKFGQLVLNTCNKSEDYVGYCTLYGDSCGAIAPIGSLYKTEVYALAGWINSNPGLPNIPDAIIDKAPSAELSDNQFDTDSLPPYDRLDRILEMHIDKKMNESAIVQAGHSASEVARVLKMVRSSEYKRQQSAPIIEITRK